MQQEGGDFLRRSLSKRVSNSKCGDCSRLGRLTLIPQPLLPEGEGGFRVLMCCSLSLRERVGVRGNLRHATIGRDWPLDTSDKLSD
jgi:hypothetical protein